MQPLYIQARNNNLGPLEVMDRETLDWISKESAKVSIDSGLEHACISRSEYDLLRQAATQADWFYSRDHVKSIHGISHNLRVTVFVLLVCKKLGITNYPPHIVAASLHDVRRINDNADPEHGNRAAEWFNRHIQQVPLVPRLTESDQETVEQAVQYHQVDYNNIPTAIYGTYGQAIDILKAADALDRYRMPKEKWWPRTDFIRLQEAHSLLGLARVLTIESEDQILDGASPVDAVFSVIEKYLMED